MRKKIVDQTLQQRLGFQDQDLVRPEHDQIVLWLRSTVPGKLREWLNLQDPDPLPKLELDAVYKRAIADLQEQKRALRENIESCTGPGARSWQADTAAQARKSLERLERIEIDPPPSEWPPLLMHRPIIEHTIIKERGQVVGFVDMAVRYSEPKLHSDVKNYKDTNSLPFYEFEPPQYIDWQPPKLVLFEVKTEIRSFGELMRQIQHYRAYATGAWFVVCPDTRFRDALKDQGVGFIESPSQLPV